MRSRVRNEHVPGKYGLQTSNNAYLELWCSHGCDKFVRSPTGSFAYGLVLRVTSCLILQAGITVSGYDMASMLRRQNSFTCMSFEDTMVKSKSGSSELQRFGVLFYMCMWSLKRCC